MDTDKMRAMLRTIENEFRYTGGLTGRFAPRQQTLDAVALVPREEFVPAHLRPFAYDNTPLPIGDGQTISQPFIVALMTDLLEPTPESVILEVGAGSGYQAAVLAQLAGQVYSMEIIPALARQAAGRLQKLRIGNVEIIVDDGSHGLPAHAPYDGIIVTAAAPEIPLPLINQLKPLGRLVLPVGRPHLPQDLLLVQKKGGEIISRSVLPVAFVPFTGKVQQD
jgi:protein-L-isoaspartate(D-aspartate) O-methyltransferase